MIAERIVLDWIKDVAPVAAKFAIMPHHVKSLVDAIDAHLSEERAQMLTWSTQAIENHKLAERLQKELDEQCRLLGMSGEREYILHGKLRQSERRAEAAEALALELAQILDNLLVGPDCPVHQYDGYAILSDERLTKLREKKNG